MSKKSIYVIIGIAVVVVAVLLVLSKKGIIGNKDKSLDVEVAKVNEITIVETVSATGKIQPEIEVKISSEVSGEIIALPVKEGQVVKKGDLLVKINPDLYTSGYNRTVAGLSQTKAGLSQADATFKEAKAKEKKNEEKQAATKDDVDIDHEERLQEVSEILRQVLSATFFTCQQVEKDFYAAVEVAEQ